VDRSMVDGDAALGHHLLEIAQGYCQLKAE